MDREMMTYDGRIARLEGQQTQTLQLLERAASNLRHQAQVIKNITERELSLFRRIEALEAKVQTLSHGPWA